MIFRRYWNQFRAWSGRCGCPRVMGALVFAGLLAACGQVSYTADEHIDRARQAHAEGDLRTAIIEIKNALQQDASRAEARRLLGLYNLEVGDVVAAESELTRALELGGDRDGIRLPLTRAWLLQGETDRVLEETRLADSFTEAQWPEALALRGTAFLYQGEVEQASTLFHETLQLEPNQADALMGLARIERFDGAVDAARSRLEQVLADNPQSDRAWELLGDMERQAGNLQEAEIAYGKAIEFTNWPFVPLLKRTLTRIGLDDLDAASRDVQALERNFALHPSVSYMRGRIAFNQERYSDARIDFEEALSREANYVPALLHLGMTHIRLGNQRQAEQYLRRHLTRSPDSVQTTYYLASLLAEAGRSAEARRLIEDAATRFNGQNIGLDVLRTQLAFAAGDDEQGLALLTGLAESRPDSAELQELLGRQLIGQGDRERGMAALRQAAAMDSAPRRADVAIILSELQAGNYQQALAAARNLQEKQPDRAAPWNFIGAALIGMGRTDEAREAFQTGLELEPEDIPTATNLGNLELQTGHHQAAREVFAAIQNHSPGHAPSAQRLAELDLQAGDPQSAMDWLRQATETQPEVLRPHLLLAGMQMERGQVQDTLRTLEHGRDHHPGHPQLLFALADIYLRLDRAGDAVAVLESALEHEPRHFELHLALAQAQSQAGDRTGMENTLLAALDIRPEHYETRTNLVQSLMQRGQLDDLASHLEYLQEHHAGRPEVQALAGRVALRRGDFKQAADYFQAAVDANPRQREWVLGLAEAQWQTGSAEVSQMTLKGWIEARPDDVLAWHLYAGRQLMHGAEDDALRAYEQILATRPEDVIALNNAAWILRKDNPQQALKYAEQAHSLESGEAGILHTLGVVLLYSGQAGQAVERLTQAAEIAPQAPEIQFHLASALAEQGDIETARAVLGELLTTHDEFAERDEAESLLETLDR